MDAFGFSINLIIYGYFLGDVYTMFYCYSGIVIDSSTQIWIEDTNCLYIIFSLSTILGASWTSTSIFYY